MIAVSHLFSTTRNQAGKRMGKGHPLGQGQGQVSQLQDLCMETPYAMIAVHDDKATECLKVS